MADRHLHLAWYGYSVCRDPGCTKPRADPQDDMICSDPDCEGDCEAARHNSGRRGLPPWPGALDAALMRAGELRMAGMSHLGSLAVAAGELARLMDDEDGADG